jgi:recombination protein RecA
MSKANGSNSTVVDLASALVRIERMFGQDSVRMLSENGSGEVEAISTGALSLDLALGIGGLPKGRVVEIYGPESSGKTTLAYHAIAEAQRLGGRCAFIDAEHSLDPTYASAIGVDTDELLLCQPDYGEQALEIADLLIRSEEVALVAIDSVAALIPKAELEGEMGQQSIGLQARMMGQALRKLAGNLRRSNAICLFTNQLREKIGVVYGPNETQPGGRALKFYASQRLDIRRVETLKDGDEAVGNRVRVKVVKNKVGAPFRVAEFDIDFGRGISQVGCVLDLAVEHGVIERRGAFFAYGEERLGRGRANVKAALEERPELVDSIAQEVREKAEESAGEIPVAPEAPKKTEPKEKETEPKETEVAVAPEEMEDSSEALEEEGVLATVGAPEDDPQDTGH